MIRSAREFRDTPRHDVPAHFVMRMTRALAPIVVSTFASGLAHAQSPPAAPETIPFGDWQLSPLVELRSRAEFRHAPVDLGGKGTATVDNAVVVFERARLGVRAQHGLLGVQLTLQDARAWGQVPPSATLSEAPSPSPFGAYEAYAEAKTSAPRPSFVRIGRQAITLGEGRLVSAADWSPAGRSLDAIHGRLSLGVWDVELLGALLHARRPLGSAFDDTTGPEGAGEELAGAVVRSSFDPLFKVELTALARFTESGAHGVDDSRFALARSAGETYVGSLRVFGEGQGWRYGVEGAYEIGRAAALAENRQAYAAAGHVAYTFAGGIFTPTLRLSASYATGDDGSATYKQFDPLLPDVHTWHGAMDVFAWSNLRDVAARVSVVPTTDTTFAIEYRLAGFVQSAADWQNAYLGNVGHAPSSGPLGLGHEGDVVFAWRPWTVMDLTVGYSVLLLGDGARAVMAAEQRGAAASPPMQGTAQGTGQGGTVVPEGLSHLAYAQMTVRVP